MDQPATRALRGHRFKRVFDVAAATVCLVVGLPVAICIALAIKLDSPGRVIFAQERLGCGRRAFKMLKFRSMKDGACGPGWTLPDDPRITRVGRLLRPVYLDEWPQMINVLRGEMSIVGPRPLVEAEAEMLSTLLPLHHTRFDVLPGITGLAQATVAADAHAEKFALDAAYVTTQCFRLDLAIILQTVAVVLRQRRPRRMEERVA